MVTLLVTPACLTLHRIIVGEAIRFPNLAETFWRYGFGRTRANLSEWLVRRMDAGELRSADPDFAAEQFLLLCQARIVIHRRFMLPVDDSPEAIRTFATITANDFMRLYGARGL
ncbi:Transcriptional regulator, TetR family [Komagataeibacter xylinus E25]|nr:Transcriptional regulator, TetR family [Komagataeibacter xylinus E25]